MSENIKPTPFSDVYNCFFSQITDDMYMELDKSQTEALVKELLLSAIPSFEFPRQDMFDYNVVDDTFNIELTQEEKNILAVYMVEKWMGQQLASIENIRMKYSGSDFKFTSQANHMQKVLQLKKDYERLGFHLQRLYKRRKKNKNGIMKSTFGTIMKEVDEDDY